MISYVRLPPVQGDPLAGVDDPLDAPLVGLEGLGAVVLEAGVGVLAAAFSFKICGRSMRKDGCCDQIGKDCQDSRRSSLAKYIILCHQTPYSPCCGIALF